MRTVVAVLRGGPSREYEVSLRTGAAVLEALDKERYETRDVFIDRGGQWHLWGAPLTPERVLRDADVVFNALHGEYGEDGTVQGILDALALPYTGSGALASALAFNKQRTREVAMKLGVKVPKGVLVKPGDPEAAALRVFRSFPQPAIVKPVTGGSSVGTTRADNFHALAWGLQRAWEHAPAALVEELIPGREATVGVINSFRNENTYALMPVEIIPPPGKSFFDYEAKYSGESIERVPAHFPLEVKRELAEIACRVHEGMGLRHYSRADLIVGKRGIYFLEINTLPGLTKESLIPKALQAVGARLSDFLHHVLSLARKPAPDA